METEYYCTLRMGQWMRLGNIVLRNRLIMAPMAGVTDRFFRALVWAHGAGLTVSEMVSAKSIVYGSRNTLRLLDNDSAVRPWAVQFFGREPEVLAAAIKRLEAWPFDIVDINMGCPMPKIVKNGEGAALMTDPVLAGRMVSAAVAASARPVTVKIRKGFTPAAANAAEMARVAQECGAAAVAVHGRTRDQYYSGEADWGAIAAVKQAVSIPVIGNGDIFTPEAAAKRAGACDGLMLARGAMGNPWLFSRTLSYLETGVLPPPPSHSEIIETAVRHLRAFAAHREAPLQGAVLRERNGIHSRAARGPGGIAPIYIEEMRKHLCWYTKGMPGSADTRRRINAAKTADEMEAILREEG